MGTPRAFKLKGELVLPQNYIFRKPRLVRTSFIVVIAEELQRLPMFPNRRQRSLLLQQPRLPRRRRSLHHRLRRCKMQCYQHHVTEQHAHELHECQQHPLLRHICVHSGCALLGIEQYVFPISYWLLSYCCLRCKACLKTLAYWNIKNAYPRVKLLTPKSAIGYPTSEATYLPSSSVRIAPGSGGYNGSNLPIQSFTGDAAKDEASNALAGAVGFAIAILAIMVV